MVYGRAANRKPVTHIEAIYQVLDELQKERLFGGGGRWACVSTAMAGIQTLVGGFVAMRVEHYIAKELIRQTNYQKRTLPIKRHFC